MNFLTPVKALVARLAAVSGSITVPPAVPHKVDSVASEGKECDI
jgi:hypothetical protein